MEVEKVGTEAILTVKNNGQMIPKHSLDSLFDRFYRVGGITFAGNWGTGLGLAIAQSIVALHGGYIFAKSTRIGPSFIIHLPLKRNDLSNTQNYG